LKRFKRKAILILKGMVMGLADVIPGVSSGTMALVTGIYQEFINAIKSFEPTIILDLFAWRLRDFWQGLKDVRWGFLVPVLFGEGFALLVASQFARFLLENYPPYTYAFFFGLILASAVLLYFEVPRSGFTTLLAGISGTVASVLIVGVSTGNFGHSLLFIFLAGAVAVSAMILPGISGAFILLLIGQYEYILDKIGNLPGSLPTLVVFGFGAALGLMSFSRVLSYALDRWRPETYGFLIGLMFGALRKPFEVLLGSAGNTTIGFSWTLQTTFLVALFGLLGIGVVIGLGYFRSTDGRS
jgi:putative membrane protein